MYLVAAGSAVITTLLDIATYSTLEIVGLYGQRWDVELDLRHLKTTLGMDVLRCKTSNSHYENNYYYHCHLCKVFS